MPRPLRDGDSITGARCDAIPLEAASMPRGNGMERSNPGKEPPSRSFAPIPRAPEVPHGTSRTRFLRDERTAIAQAPLRVIVARPAEAERAPRRRSEKRQLSCSGRATPPQGRSWRRSKDSTAANRGRTRDARHRLRGDGRTRPDRKVRKPSGGFTTKTDRRIPVRWGAARPPRRFAGRNAPPSRAARRVRRMDPVRIGNRDDRRSTRRPRGRRIAPFDECAAMTAPNPPSALPSGSRGRAPKAPRRAVRTLAPTLSRTINTNIALYLNRQDKTP